MPAGEKVKSWVQVSAIRSAETAKASKPSVEVHADKVREKPCVPLARYASLKDTALYDRRSTAIDSDNMKLIGVALGREAHAYALHFAPR